MKLLSDEKYKSKPNIDGSLIMDYWKKLII
jgi:hypothetical protein